MKYVIFVHVLEADYHIAISTSTLSEWGPT